MTHSLLTPTARLRELGLTLPALTRPVADYVPAVTAGGFVYTSGQLPLRDGALLGSGSVGDAVTVEEARELARACALNGLAVIDDLVGLDAVARVVKLTGFVASAPGFSAQSAVIDGASALMREVFGENGSHARSAIGVMALPLGAPVEVEIVVQLRPE